MNRAKIAQSYKANSVDTASPGKLILMLFEGAVRFTKEAQAGFALTDFTQRNEQVHNSIVRVQHIVIELQACLNMQEGGKFAQTMHGLYGYLFSNLQKANMHKQKEPLAEVLKILEDLTGAWAEMLRSSEHRVLNN